MVASKEGLAAPVETPAAALNLFEVRNEAGEWFPAEAKISGKTVLVRSDKAPRLVAVRYAFQKTPEGCNLYNRDGLPASHAYDLVYRHALDVDASGEVLAMGSTTGSLWISDDAGKHWTMASANLPPIHFTRFV